MSIKLITSFCQLLALAFTVDALVLSQTNIGPDPMPMLSPTYSARDSSFNGAIRLDVDASDTSHKIFVVHETIPVQNAGPMVLLYPQWDTGSHAPTISVANLAGLYVKTENRLLAWQRDAIDSHAFHVAIPAGVKQLNLEFQYLSPPSSRAGAMLMTSDIIQIPWQNMLLYPAGWYLRNIMVEASLRLPPGFQLASALELAHLDLAKVLFLPTSLETLIDSPVYAGRYFHQWDLAPGEAIPVRLSAVADSAEDLALSSEALSRMRAMVDETRRLFQSSHYKHYDLLFSLSDHLPNDGGLEHLQSSEVNMPADFFRNDHDHLNMQDLIAHEYVHSWNGLFRQPADLWVPDLNTPMRDSLLWVYEGQTEFWALALAARAGQLYSSQALDTLAVDAAAAQARLGRSWKSLDDSNNDPLYDAGHAVPWPDWQRREDYYGEGVLLWLDVDTKIQELTHGHNSLVNFARTFFGSGSGDLTTHTYTFADLCRALNGIAPFDWQSFLETRLQAHDATHLLDGLTHAGYQLTFSDQPSEVFRQNEVEEGATDLSYSVGMKVTKTGAVKNASWAGPAFNARISVGSQINTVNGRPFTPQILLAAVESSNTEPIKLGIVQDGKASMVEVEYRGTLAYPHLQPIAGTADRLLPWLRKTQGPTSK